MKNKMNLSLKFDPKAVLPALNKIRPYLAGAALIGVFGYTAYIVNGALNVEPAVLQTQAPKISFDKATITAIKNLDVVSGQVPTGTIGKDNPFTR